MKCIPVVIVIFLLVILGGCASASLTVNVDLYDEDPRVVPPMTPEDVERIIKDLQALEREAVEERNLSNRVVQRSYLAFASAWKRAGGDPNALKKLKKQKKSFLDSFDEPKKRFHNILADVYTELQDYSKRYVEEHNSEAARQTKQAEATDLGTETSAGVEKPNTCKYPDGCDEAPSIFRRFVDWLNGRHRATTPHLGDEDIQRALVRNANLKKQENEIVLKLTEVISAYWAQRTTDEQFFVNWGDLEHLLITKYLLAERNRRKEEMKLLEEIAIETRDQVQLLAMELAQYAGIEPAGIRVPLPGRPDSLFESTAAIGAELESLRNGLPNNATSRAALSSLVQNTARFLEFIDRLQDPGDPVWRIVSDPANEGHWNTEFSETYFMAEGKSEVVIVRDSPMRFRIQNGANDPAALIEGQLLIARAVSNAALSIAGAATGLPTDALASAQGSTNAGTGNKPPEEEFQKRRAKAEAEARRREKTMSGLTSLLSNVSRNLDMLNSPEATAAQRQRLISYLKGYKASLEGLNVDN